MNIISVCVTEKKKLLAPINFLPKVYDQYPRGLLVYLTYTSKHGACQALYSYFS